MLGLPLSDRASERQYYGLVIVSGGPSEAVDLPKPDRSGRIESDSTENALLYVIGSLDLGGTERHLALIAPRLKRFGLNSSVYCLTQPGQLASEVSQAGVCVIPPPFAFAPQQDCFAVRGLKLFLSALKLFWVMLTARPRVVHFFLPASYLIGAPLSLAARVPIRVMSRRSLNRYQARNPFLGHCERWLHRRMTAILGNSRAVLRELVDEEGCPPECVALIYNGISVSGFKVERSSVDKGNGQGERPLVLITVANLIPYKGHSDLIAALGEIAAALPVGWSLRCVGREDGVGAGLKQQARALGIEDNVKFLGARTDIAALLATADIAVLASHEEGFANSILEGMAAGLPMVVTDVGGNGEAVVDGVTGLVVPPHNIRALGAAILELANDPNKRLAMGKLGRERAKMLFDIDRCVTSYARLYMGLREGLLPGEIAELTSLSASLSDVAVHDRK